MMSLFSVFNVRLELWDKMGNNLGCETESMILDGIEQAKDLARNLYGKYDAHCKQLTISDEDHVRIWKYKDP